MTRTLTLLALALALLATAAPARAAGPTNIVGGYYPAASQWPWATLLVYSDRYYQGNDFDRKFCTATLISPTRVLTAGHCVAEDETGKKLVDPRKIQALVGRRRASDPSTGERIDVAAIAIHPKYYAPESGPYENQAYYDLAVLFLAHPASIQPATIGTPDDFGERATAMGWGHIDHDADITSDDLKAADLDLWSDEECSAAVDTATTQYYFPSIHVCAGGDGVNGVCHGDSGGGLMVTPDRGQTWKLIGVTSFYPPGSHCTSAGHPTGFAWVAGPTLRDWPLTVAQPAGPAVTPDPSPRRRRRPRRARPPRPPTSPPRPRPWRAPPRAGRSA